MPYALLLDTEPQQQRTAEATKDTRILGESAGLWAAESLMRDGGAVLEIKPENWEHAMAKLVERGLDVKELQAKGRIVVLDAYKVLAEITADGSARPAVFNGIVDEAIQRVRMASDEEHLHVWTDTVDLLSEHHGPWMAQFARSLWNAAAHNHGVSLLGSSILDGDLDLAEFEADSVEGWTEYVPGASLSSEPSDP